MQRFINDPDLVVEDTVKGFVKAHGDILRIGQNPRVIVAKDAPVAGKVGVITGGGSGLGPDALSGYAEYAPDVLLPWRYDLFPALLTLLGLLCVLRGRPAFTPSGASLPRSRRSPPVATRA